MRNFLLFAFLTCCAALAGAYAADAPASTPSTTQAAPQYSLVKHGSLIMTVDGQGALDAVDPFEVRLRFKAYQGDLTIVSIASNGAAVKKGDILLEIDPATMKRTVAAIENEALGANAALEKSKADAKVSEQVDLLALRQQEAAVKEAEANVKWFETMDGPQMLKGIDMQLSATKNYVSDAEDELDQLKKLYKSEELTNATADIVVKRAVRNLDKSKVAFGMAEEQANKSRVFLYPITKQRVYDAQEAAHEQFAFFENGQKQTKILRKTAIAASVAAADAAYLRLAEIKSDADKLVVRAPSDGIVCYGQIVHGAWSGADPRTLRPGEKIAAQTVVMTLYQPGHLRVALDLPEAKFFAIAPGQKASISPIAFPELKYEGMCDVLPHTVGNLTMTISTGVVDSRLAPAMKAQYHMDVTLADSVLLAPETAVANSTVSIKTATGTESRHVLTGRSDGKSVEILSGLRDGDEVLTQAK